MNVVVIPLHMNVEITLSGHCSFFKRASTVGHIRCRLISEHVIDQRAIGIDDISDVGIAWLCLGNVRREDVIQKRDCIGSRDDPGADGGMVFVDVVVIPRPCRSNPPD